MILAKKGFANSKLITPAQVRSAIPTATPPRKWHTTIDYRHYNNWIVKQHWPLPSISVMKARIGKAKPKCFAELDMTNGYWLALLAEQCKAYMAFICFIGIFEWNRAPRGTQPAGGCFQHHKNNILMTKSKTSIQTMSVLKGKITRSQIPGHDYFSPP